MSQRKIFVAVYATATIFVNSVLNSADINESKVRRLLRSENKNDAAEAVQLIVAAPKSATKLLPEIAAARHTATLVDALRVVLPHATPAEVIAAAEQAHPAARWFVVLELARRAHPSLKSQPVAISRDKVCTLLVKLATKMKSGPLKAATLNKLRFVRMTVPPLSVDEDEVELLFSLLKDDTVVFEKSQTTMQSVAIESLADCFQRVEPRLIKGLDHPSRKHQAAVVRLLSSRNSIDEEFAARLLKLGESEDPTVRLAVVKAFERSLLRTNEATSLLISYTTSPGNVQAAAIAALPIVARRADVTSQRSALAAILEHMDAARGKEIGSPEVRVAQMAQFSAQTLMTSLPEEVARAEVERLLPKLDDAQLAPAYLAVLASAGESAAAALPQTRRIVAEETNLSSKARLARHLWAIEQRPEVVLPIFFSALESPDSHEVALTSLAQMGPSAKPALSLLIKYLQQPDYDSVRDCMYVIRQIGPVAGPATITVSKYLDDEDESHSYVALRTIKAIGPNAAEAVPTLTRLLTHERSSIRRTTISVLAAIGPPAESALDELQRIADTKKGTEARMAGDAIDTIRQKPSE